MYRIITALSKNRGIGYRGKLPWNIRKDMNFFKNTTSNVLNKKKINAVVCGRTTWESIPPKFRPLPNRLNIVLSSSMPEEENVTVCRNLDEVHDYIYQNRKKIESTYVIGGSSVYKQFLDNDLVSDVYFTEIDKDYQCDVFMPELDNDKFKLISSKEEAENDVNMKFNHYEYQNKEEQNYLDLMKEIIDNGVPSGDRTGTGTNSLFGRMLKYDIRDGKLPLLTSKRTFIRGIIEEMLFFVSGSTDTTRLEEKGVNIWKGNTTREFLDNRGLNHLPVGDLGAGYSFQWKYFGAKYIDCKTDYTGQGYDQIQNAINLIKNNPQSRRILISGWNPVDLSKTALPPCFLKDTPVLTEDGYKFIQDIEEGEFLFTHKNNIRKINKKYITNYSGDIYELNIQYIPKINTTPEHPFFVRKVIYKNNPKLKMIECSEPSWVDAKNLDKNHYHGIKINTEKIIPEFTIKKNLNKYTTIDIKKILNNKDEWYFLGYYLGDGWSRWDRKGAFYLVFNNKDEEELKKRFENICKTRRLKQKQKGCSVYEYHSYVLSHILKMFGRKAHNKIIPNWVLDAPTEYLEEFIKGYVKADGCHFEASGNITTAITTTSKDIALKIQLILLKSNIFSSVKFQKKPSTCVIEGRTVNQRNLWKISFIKNRKRQIRSFIKDGYAWLPFISKKIKKVENTNVYNFDVEEDHTYIVNNISVHNCHVVYQFYVNVDKKELSCLLYQRSSDYFLANNYNATGAIILTHMLAHITGLKTGEFTHFLGDTHVYSNHIEQCKTQMERSTMPFPKLVVNPSNREINDINDFKYEDFKVVNYYPHPTIKADMAV